MKWKYYVWVNSMGSKKQYLVKHSLHFPFLQPWNWLTTMNSAFLMNYGVLDPANKNTAHPLNLNFTETVNNILGWVYPKYCMRLVYIRNCFLSDIQNWTLSILSGNSTYNGHVDWIKTKLCFCKPLKFEGCLFLQYNLTYPD